MLDGYCVIIATPYTANSEALFDYTSDGRLFDTRRAAIEHGYRVADSDDFNIGVFEEGNLVSFDWMDEVVDTDPVVLQRIQSLMHW